jgi:hypothetical protein
MEVHRAYVSHLRSLRASWWTRHEERLLSRCEEENFAQASSIERMRGTENYTQLLEDFDRACTYYCKHFVHIVFEACRDDPEVDDLSSTAPSTAVSPCVASGATRATHCARGRAVGIDSCRCQHAAYGTRASGDVVHRRGQLGGPHAARRVNKKEPFMYYLQARVIKMRDVAAQDIQRGS